jgi:hypothetical protein
MFAKTNILLATNSLEAINPEKIGTDLSLFKIGLKHMLHVQAKHVE